MSRKIILYIAASIDGYIAEKDGGIKFLTELEMTEEENSYEELMNRIDTVVMGRTTYDQVVNELSMDEYPYEEQMSYIITHKKEKNQKKRIFTNENPVELVKQLKKQEGKDIWIVGGGSIIAPLVEENLIDSYVITTIPVLLGEGIPLFQHFSGKVSVKLTDVYQANGLIYATYEKK